MSDFLWISFHFTPNENFSTIFFSLFLHFLAISSTDSYTTTIITLNREKNYILIILNYWWLHLLASFFSLAFLTIFFHLLILKKTEKNFLTHFFVVVSTTMRNYYDYVNCCSFVSLIFGNYFAEIKRMEWQPMKDSSEVSENKGSRRLGDLWLFF